MFFSFLSFYVKSRANLPCDKLATKLIRSIPQTRLIIDTRRINGFTRHLLEKISCKIIYVCVSVCAHTRAPLCIHTESEGELVKKKKTAQDQINSEITRVMQVAFGFFSYQRSSQWWPLDRRHVCVG